MLQVVKLIFTVYNEQTVNFQNNTHELPIINPATLVTITVRNVVAAR